MSGELGRRGRWAALHRRRVLLAQAGSAYSPARRTHARRRRLGFAVRSLAAAGIPPAGR
jgi:hypothetical protein